MEVKVIWWNTSMSPPVKNKNRKRKDPKNYIAVVSQLLRDGVHVLGLGEVDALDLIELKDVLATKAFQDYELVELTQHEERLQHLALVFDKRYFARDGNEEYVTSPKRKVVYFRAGVRVPLKAHTGEIFNVYLSHWQCRRTYSTSAARRGLGEQLRGSIESVFGIDEDAHIIAMGDYNDEPYSESMVYGLQSGRDKHHFFDVKDKQILYNPFWRAMGGVFPYDVGVTSDRNTPSGTCYFRDRQEFTDWKTVDQILFSTSFLGASNWHLIEKDTRIYSLPELGAAVAKLQDASDHLPVRCVVRRV